jgi:23S rRNA pseudouridine1911/1915/1917 synthase
VQTIRDPAIRDRLSVIHRQALHACDLSFTHPRTGEALTFHSDPPPDWQEILELMRKA